jgi:hypothetical protein
MDGKHIYFLGLSPSVGVELFLGGSEWNICGFILLR